jgi:MFS family permease
LSTDPGQGTVAARGAFRLHRWSDRAVVGAGFGQFGVVAALGDVARGFGQADNGGTLVAQAGLSGTDLGIGLAIMRLASLGALPVIGLADRFGRRTLLLATVGIGLALTVVAAASPTYWWFVAIKPGPVKGGIRLEPPRFWPAETACT